MIAQQLLDELLDCWREARDKGLDREASDRAAAYTERRIRELKVSTKGEVRVCYAAFADAFMTGRGHCGQAAPK